MNRRRTPEQPLLGLDAAPAKEPQRRAAQKATKEPVLCVEERCVPVQVRGEASLIRWKGLSSNSHRWQNWWVKFAVAVAYAAPLPCTVNPHPKAESLAHLGIVGSRI